MIELITSIE